ncbi:hypothetical protein Hanom_Chr14g01285241 [Helianthus anomalus]
MDTNTTTTYINTIIEFNHLTQDNRLRLYISGSGRIFLAAVHMQYRIQLYIIIIPTQYT